jgi:fatty acid desaturase
MLVAGTIYAGCALVTWYHALLPGWLLAVCGGWLVAWHGSLQHETIHGHPTSNTRLNALIGMAPLSLWLPYAVYRRTHLAHHRTDGVTDPYADPESRYLVERVGPIAALRHLAARTQASLAGRLLAGPAIVILGFLLGEGRRARREPSVFLRDWLPHIGATLLVWLWLRTCGLGLVEYGLAFVYPGTALSLLRSYAEHRAAPAPGHRVAIVERAGLFALLFLNNNLHATHHRAPGLAWYRLPAFHRRHRRRLLADNGNLLYDGYGEVARRFLLRPHDDLIHPDHRARPTQP